MSSATPAPSKSSREELVLSVFDCAFRAIDKSGWKEFNLFEVCTQEGIPSAWMRKHCPSKERLIGLLNEAADVQAFEDTKNDQCADTKEQIFNCLMARLDFFDRYKVGIVRMLNDLPCDPPCLVKFSVDTAQSMEWLGNTMSLGGSFVKSFARANAIAVLWGLTLRTWIKDDSADLADSMAILDQGLEKIKNIGLID